jgi:hypothetical protein
LRDRNLPGGAFPGNGHRNSLNPLISTHAVIMDLTAGIFWAASPPHQLGKFVAFDINDPEKLLPNLEIPADPMIASGEYDGFLQSQKAEADGWAALKKNDVEGAIQFAHIAETNNPGFYHTSWLLATALAQQGKNDEASKLVAAAVKGQPALAGERKKLELLSKKIGSTSP